MAFALGIDHLDGDEIQFADFVLPRPNSSVLFRVRNNDLEDVGILRGDIVVVDRAQSLRRDSIALVSVDGSPRLVRRDAGRFRDLTEDASPAIELIGVGSRLVRVLLP
jgi:SOS-response transcriptional repressor LexA